MSVSIKDTWKQAFRDGPLGHLVACLNLNPEEAARLRNAKALNDAYLCLKDQKKPYSEFGSRPDLYVLQQRNPALLFAYWQEGGTMLNDQPYNGLKPRDHAVNAAIGMADPDEFLREAGGAGVDFDGHKMKAGEQNFIHEAGKTGQPVLLRVLADIMGNSFLHAARLKDPEGHGLVFHLHRSGLDSHSVRAILKDCQNYSSLSHPTSSDIRPILHFAPAPGKKPVSNDEAGLEHLSSKVAPVQASTPCLR